MQAEEWGPVLLRRMRSFARSQRAALALLAAWAAMALFIWPVGEFAINDDWAFSIPAKWLAEDGALRFTHWSAMTLITQIGFGALWIAVFGFSQLGLRVLVILFAAAALVAAYLYAREHGFSKRVSALVAALLLSFPVFSAMSTSFMTDTPYLTLSLLAALFLVRSLSDTQTWRRDFFIGALFVALAVMLRQTGVALALAFAAADFITHGIRKRTIVRSAALLALSAALLVLFSTVIAAAIELPAHVGDKTDGVRAFIEDAVNFEFRPVWFFVATAFWGLVYAGLFASPLALGVAAARAAGARRVATLGPLLAVTALFVTLLALTGGPFPRGNIFETDGIGPLLIWPYQDNYPQDVGFSVALATAASLGMAYLTIEAVSGARRLWSERTNVATRRAAGLIAFSLILGAATYAPYCIYYGLWTERYLMLTAFCILIAVAAAAPGFRADAERAFPVACAAIAVWAVLCAAMVRDYFDWSRTRYALIERAIEAYGALPEDIDGGFEYVNFSAHLSASYDTAPIDLIKTADRAFQLSKTPREGYETLETVSAPHILPIRNSNVYLLHRLQSGPEAGG